MSKRDVLDRTMAARRKKFSEVDEKAKSLPWNDKELNLNEYIKHVDNFDV